jgi:acetyl esterase/lipase
VNTEGSDLAKWLNKKGIAAFVLQYRLVHSESNSPVKEKNERMKDTARWRSTVTPVVYLGIQDARQSISFVRAHAKELGIAQNKIGIVGFSAGGTLAAACALDHSDENRPDFVAPVYAFVPDILIPASIKNPPPLFIAAATDDELHLVPMSVKLYNKWLANGSSAELHIYSKGGHGFGMNKHNQPSDTWIERFSEWLKVEGFL